MMTVREMAIAVEDAKNIELIYDGWTHPYIKEDELSVGAYGDYIVKSFSSDADKLYSFRIALKPLKAGDIA